MLQSSTSSSNFTLPCSSSSISSDSSSSPPPSFNNKKKKAQKTMDEVWNEITIASLPTTPIHHIHNIHHPTQNPHFRGMTLQDFLTTEPQQQPIKKPPTTEFQFFDSEIMMNSEPQNLHGIQGRSSSVVANLIGLNSGVAAFDALASSSVLTSFGGINNTNDKKRVSQGGGDQSNGCVDRRHKRMIKNRESAARSRARKQAYVTELRMEIDQLKEENEMLKNLQRQANEAMQFNEAPMASSGMLPKKHSLYRTSTAPF